MRRKATEMEIFFKNEVSAKEWGKVNQSESAYQRSSMK